jgi:hypothetical protein
MAGGSGDYQDEGDESDERDTIPTTSRRRWHATELETFDLVTSYVHRYEGEDGDNADADVDHDPEVTQADDGSMYNIEDLSGNE